MTRPATSPPFSGLLQNFFLERLINQRNVSPCTVAAYRDTFRILLQYLQEHHHKSAANVTLSDLDAPRILAFLDHLEAVRKNAIPSRNARLAALRSFLKYAAGHDPASLPVIQRVLAIPVKRYDRRVLGFLSREEVQAIMESPDPGTWSGQRDRMLFHLLYNTGARVSEIVSLCIADVLLGHGATVRIQGKGRKERSVPLWKDTVAELKQWMRCIDRAPASPLLPNASGKPLSRSGVEHRLKKAVRAAATRQPTLAKRAISPHTFRHTTAMHMLQSGTDLSVIALWLGHESPATTHMYMVADPVMKERALQRLEPLPTKRFRYRPTDKLLQFLEGL
ncbi:MAG: site-specific integrase [Planctomycetota bacterium]